MDGIKKNKSLDLYNEDLLKLIGKNAEYYVNVFQEMEEENKVKSWNWSAFFLNIYWLLYRKMYFIGSLTAAFYLMFGFIPYIGPVMDIGITFYLGCYGNKLYKNHIQHEYILINELKYSKKQKAINHKGGTNIAIPLFLGFIILSIIWVFRIFWYVHFHM